MSFKSEAQIVFNNDLRGGGGGVPPNDTVMEPGSGGNNANSGANNNSNSEMPGGMPGMMGMPGMPMMPGLAGGGMMPNDSRLAEEFVKLQQDFFKWQQQLLQNQHVLHSRVAPLASNPPQLQSVGVMRDIMSHQSPQAQEVGSSRDAVDMTGGTVPKGPSAPVERVIPIKMEITTTTTVRENEPRPANTLMPGTAARGLSQSMQDISSDMGQLSSTNKRVSPPTNTQYQHQPPPPRRWAEEPNVSVGSWVERPSQPVGVYHDQDYVTSAPRSRSTQDLSSVPLPSSTDQLQQRSGFFPTSRGGHTQGYAQPESMQSQPQPQFVPTQPHSQHVQSPTQQLHSLPPQQQQQFAQFLQQQQQQQQQQQLPDRATFWRDYDPNKHPSSSIKPPGVIEQQKPEEPTRPPRRNSTRQDSPPQDSSEPPRPPLTYFGQEVVVQEPPHTYYYNGDGGGGPPPPVQSALSKVANNASAPPRPPYPKTLESESSGPRYTSVVTLSSDKGDQAAGEPPAKDKVRSVVQLNTDPRNNMPRTAPVVRGFRQPGEERPNQGNTFHSKIISNAIKNQPPSQPQGRSSISPPASHEGGGFISAQNVPVPEAPAAAKLVAAVASSQPAAVVPKAPTLPSPVTQVPCARVSPPRITQSSRVSPVRSSPSRTSPSSGPAFGNVQLRPVPVGLRASPEPSDVTPQPPTSLPPSAPVNPVGNIPPPPPPAPPMAPPPPPPPVSAAANGERRTASGKRIVSPKTGPELDPREELMMAIRNHGGLNNLRKTRNFSEA